MAKNKSVTRKSIILLTIVFLGIGGVLSASYAFFIKYYNGNQMSYTTGTLQITLDTTETGYGETINLASTVAVTDEEGKSSNPYKFKIKNTGTLAYQFDLKLISDPDKVATDNCSNNQLANEYIKIQINEETPNTLNNYTDNKILQQLTLAPNEEMEVILRVWLDYNTPISEVEKHFHGKLTTDGMAITLYAMANEPDLPEGMIPVVYNETNSTWETVAVPYKLGDVNGDGIINVNDSLKANRILNNWITYERWQYAATDVNNDSIVSQEDIDLINNAESHTITTFPAGGILEEKMYIPTGSDKSWYNYDNKKWANAVMVTSATRETYMNASSGTAITQSDILAFYVWIPRYRYKLFNVEFASVSPQTIDISFESKNDAIYNGKCGDKYSEYTNNCYLSHPAFWWDNDSDGVREAGEELSGIWVGKFEMTGSTTTPTILPNTNPLRSQNVSTLFSNSQKLGTSTYLTTNGVNQVDSHMMKNMEWGAVAYLSHSKYGINGNIGINNYYNSGPMTGCGSLPGSSSSTICNAYNTLNGMQVSTTKNITGIYDMSAGVTEYVMSVVQDESMTNIPLYSSSGFNATTMPSSKYYELYTFGTTDRDHTAYNRSRIGDATGETRGWYDDDSYFAQNELPWFLRGGNYNGAAGSGIFLIGRNTGTSTSYYGTRAVLIRP